MPPRPELDRLAAESTAPRGAIAPVLRTPPVPALTVAWHPDAERVGERVVLFELVAGREVELSRLTPRFAAPGREP